MAFTRHRREVLTAFYDRFFIIMIVKHSTRHRREVLAALLYLFKILIFSPVTAVRL